VDNKKTLIDNVIGNPNNLDTISINVIDVDGIHYVLKTLVHPSQNLMEVLREVEFAMGHCGGMALCASCHCYIESTHDLNEKEADEEAMLDQLQNINFDKSRLVCQIPMSKSLDGLTLKIIRD
jgi:ferredoxin